MKKLLLIFAVFAVGSSLVSCNKKLKDDINDLKGQVTDLQSQNDSLRTIVGIDAPMTATTTFQDSTGATRTISGEYKFKSSDYYSQRAAKISDTAYHIYITRYAEMNGDEGASLEFYYNPTTKRVYYVEGEHYWADADPYGNNADYYYYYSTGLTMSVTVESFDTTTGAISLKFDAAGTSAYTNSVPDYYIPMAGKPVSTKFSFAGKLKIYTTK